jgi:IclR family pca regulon transcriptional regulator
VPQATGRKSPSAESAGDRPGYFVQSLERGFAVIRAFTAVHSQLTAAEVARRCNLDRAAVRRFLLTLIDLGYVQTDGKVYWLRPRILELGYAYLSSLSLPEISQAHMERLVQEVHETSSLGVLDGSEVVFVNRVVTRQILTVPIMVGSRFPAYATSMGRVLLSDLPDDRLDEYIGSVSIDPPTRNTITDPGQLKAVVRRVRTAGFALVDKEMDDVTRSLAVPIRAKNGRVVAALNISTAASRRSVQELRSYLPALTAAAQAIEADLTPTTSRGYPTA